MLELNRRFYDKNQLIKTSVDVLNQFPKDLQGVVAKALCSLAVRDYDIEGRIQHLRSLGAEVVLPLYRSKNKLRTYDQVPEIHQSINYLRLLQEDERALIATKLLDVASLVEYYLGFAEEVPMPQKQVDVGEIRERYLSGGQQYARSFVVQRSQEILEQCLLQKANLDAGRIVSQKNL